MKRNKAFKPKSGAKPPQRKPTGTQGKFSPKRREDSLGDGPRRAGPRKETEERGRPEKREWQPKGKGPSRERERPERPKGREWQPERKGPSSEQKRPEKREWHPEERRRERPKDTSWNSDYKRPRQEERASGFNKERPRPALLKKPVEVAPPKQSQYVAHHGQMIMGKNCVREVLRHSPNRLVRVYTSKEEGDELLDQLHIAKIEVVVMMKDQLSAMIDSESHQSFVAQVRPRPELCGDDYLETSKEKDLVLALDSISDPQNLGAILRAAECFGVGAVMWSKNRGVEVTPVVTKVSVGASELLSLLKVSNLVEELKKFKKAGYAIVTAEVDAEAKSLFEFNFPEKTVLVLGSEGEGIRKLLSTQADFRVYVPMAGKIDSLNVSQATSVFLSRWNAS